MYVGNRALESFVNLAFRSFDVGHLALTLETFAFQDNLATIGISIGDVPPDADCIGVLLRGVNLDLNGELVVFAEDVLHGVNVVLAHIGKSAAIIVEVAAEGLVRTMDVVGLVGSRAEPEVVVELLGYGLNFEVLLTYPEEFPCETSCA